MKNWTWVSMCSHFVEFKNYSLAINSQNVLKVGTTADNLMQGVLYVWEVIALTPLQRRQEIGPIYETFFSHNTYRNFLVLLLLYFFILPFLRTECHYTDKLLYSCKMGPLQQWKLPLNMYVTNAYNLKFWFSGTNFQLTWQGNEMKFLSQLKVLVFLIPVSPVSVSDKLLDRKFIMKTWKSINSNAGFSTLVLT